MRRLPRPARLQDSLLRTAIRKVTDRRDTRFVPVLAGTVLLALAPSGQALTLGDINVRSTLGQALNASVPVRLGPGEALASACITPARETSDLRQVPGVQIVTPEASREGLYQLEVSSANALYEPMYELQLKVQCPGAPTIVRQYVLMLDLPAAIGSTAPDPAASDTGPVTPVAAAPEPPSGASNPDTTGRAATVTRPRLTRSQPGPAIAAGTRYRIVAGDSLSSIAARVRDRSGSIWAMADAIQAANPGAFIRNDPNLIKLGSEILIPAGTAPGAVALGSEQSPVAPGPVAVPAAATPMPAAAPAVAATPLSPPEPVAPTATAPVTPVVAPAPAEQRAARAAPAEPAATITAADEEPGTSPLASAAAGIFFGLCISAGLWFRGRKSSRRRPLSAADPADDGFGNERAANTVVDSIPLVTRNLEPSFSVSYTPAEDSLAAEFAPEPARDTGSFPTPHTVAVATEKEDITSELEELFDSTDTTIQKRLNAEKTLAALSLGEVADAARAHSEPVDFLIGEADEDATQQSRTVDQPRTVQEPEYQTGTGDLRALAASAGKDDQQAQTLLEALTLLERDYEEELTASQVLDMSAMRDALGDDLDEPTQISDARRRKQVR